MIRESLAKLETLTIDRSPLLGIRMAGVQEAQPRLTVRVKHLAGSKYLRHGTVRAATVSSPLFSRSLQTGFPAVRAKVLGLQALSNEEASAAMPHRMLEAIALPRP